MRNAPCLTTVVARLFWRILGGGLVCSASVVGGWRGGGLREAHAQCEKKTLYTHGNESLEIDFYPRAIDK